ncbi:hypothetical protein EWM64_g6421 [Hericium alpestre]|uniref:Uncharacterized protein n=1 Tax=Hericium alpestre TaxID=135208 RepID=A0A4Y9ZU97_9AGAM|nr:hypothetical protein EWM64_g6421 [Hericium alpestre]
MIWKMDPFLMPHAFCVAQAALISLSAYVLTGICACFAIATYLSVFKSQQLTQTSRSTLSWRPSYFFLVVVYPALAFTAHLTVLLKLDAVKPSNDMHCDATDPLWPRMLSYAGVPLIVSIPCFILSTFTAIRVFHAHSHSRRYCYNAEGTPSFTRLPVRSRRRRCRAPFSVPTPSHALKLPTKDESSLDTARDLKLANTFDVPVSPTTTAHSVPHAKPLSAKTSETTIYAQSPPSPSPAPSVRTARSDSSSPITFAPVPNKSKANAGPPPPPTTEVPLNYSPSFFDSGALYPATATALPGPDILPHEPSSPTSSRTPVSPGFNVRAFHLPLRQSIESDTDWRSFALARHDHDLGGVEEVEEGMLHHVETLPWQSEHREARGDEEDGASVMKGELEFEEARIPQSSVGLTFNRASRQSTGPATSLCPAVWRILTFQLAFFVVMALASLSTIIDLAKGRPPTPFGTQHIALILAGWGPAIVFGHLRGVRKRLRGNR